VSYSSWITTKRGQLERDLQMAEDGGLEERAVLADVATAGGNASGIQRKSLCIGVLRGLAQIVVATRDSTLGDG